MSNASANRKIIVALDEFDDELESINPNSDVVSRGFLFLGISVFGLLSKIIRAEIQAELDREEGDT